MRLAHIDMTQPNENCPAGFRKVNANGRQCVEVKVQGVLVPLFFHMDSSTVECVGESLATSTTVLMLLAITQSMEDLLTFTLLMV